MFSLTLSEPLARSRPVRFGPALAALLAWFCLGPLVAPRLAHPRDNSLVGVRAMPGTAAPLLATFYEDFLRDQDIEAFRENVTARYTEGTLIRLLTSNDVRARRAAVLALGLTGTYGCNGAVAKALADADATVRALTVNALWAIWFRADTPENNELLERVTDLINRRQFDAAIIHVNRLIAKAPKFAEAYNQRAIAHCLMGSLEESVADCRKALELNPFHIGAISGMGQCYLRLRRPTDALKAFKKALEIQPFNESLRETVRELEAVE